MTRSSIDPAVMVEAVRAGMAAIVAQAAAAGEVAYKSDRSPVTEADEAAERAIIAVIEAASDVPIVAEERFAAGHIPEVGRRFLLIDPLDGTKSFIAGTPDYTVNVALIEAGIPVFGCVGIPATGVVFHGGIGSPPVVERDDAVHPLAARAALSALDVVASRSHLTPRTESYLSRVVVGERQSIGSSLKFCLLAEGRADLYPRFGRTMQWDTAAGDAILRAAGGLTVRVDGMPLAYGLTGSDGEDPFANPDFIAVGDRSLLRRAGILPGPDQ
ncbi:3'(2'),5'-bisphosphate nucleotidase CysQ [Aurantimonas aggregata]|uniref:3'(2'),5'-bisphosphate nucleotidase CysQ n=1 Tax=Aurantimonas aggregata TaxID=2047720 RepID=A0A6L9MGI4_9HYPH|nr:3'(2'),5'-bisphosphate nucleotidase CysQ [Aurantimonas aggregata]